MTTLKTLFAFDGAHGSSPYAGVILDANGDLFGTTYYGGANGYGTVFELAKTTGGYAATPTILASLDFKSFAFTTADLMMDKSGNVFGTAFIGGTPGQGGDGCVFEIAKTASGYASAPSVLATFNDANGSGPIYGLVSDSNGNLFGTTSGALVSGNGTVFEIAKTASGYSQLATTLGTFTGNGTLASVRIMIDSAGNIIGTSEFGGASGNGEIFEIAKTAGGFAASVTIADFGPADGHNPIAPLVADSNGNLFGTTTAGGASGNGTVFEIVKTATGYASAIKTLASFDGTDGGHPDGALLIDAGGNLFGTTANGGANDDGVVFKIAKTASGYAGAPTVLVTFTGTNGIAPDAGLTVDSNGILYGMTNSGGANGEGTIFALTGTGFQLTATAITIGGTDGNQVVFDNRTIKPFSGVTITDPNAGQTESLTITLSASAAGVLTNLGGGHYDAATGTFTDTGTAAAITSDIDALVFVPTAHQVAPGNAVTTTFTIADSNTASINATDGTTMVVATAVATPTGPVSAALALDDFAAGVVTTPVAVIDSAANVATKIDDLQAVAAAGDLKGIILTDSETPSIGITATQLTNDATVLGAIGSPCALKISTDAPNQTITGLHPLDTVTFLEPVSFCTITSANSGDSYTVSYFDFVSGKTSVDHLSNIEFVQFSDRTELVATAAEAKVALLYQGILGRTPDPAGLVGWQSTFASEPAAAQNGDVFTALAGTTVGGLPNLTYGFTQSVEFKTKYGPLTDSQFVTQLYANVLDRTPDAAGLSGWIDALNAGHAREWVVVGFVESAEAYHNAEVGFTGQTGTVHTPWLVLI